jgi:hypothetical protein
MYRIALVCGFLLVAKSAFAQFLTYSEWDQLNPNSRAAYMMGAFDSLTTIVSDQRGAAAAKHYTACIADSHMTQFQLAENVRTYASTRPEEHTKMAVVVMLGYLIAACGRPQEP